MKFSERIIVGATALAVACSLFAKPTSALANGCEKNNAPTECYCNNATLGSPIGYTCVVNGVNYVCAKQTWIYNVPSYNEVTNNCHGTGCTTSSYCCTYSVITGCK